MQTAPVSAVLVTHQNEEGLRSMIGNLIYQTVKPWEIIVVHSDYSMDRIELLRHDFKGYPMVWFRDRNRDDWGHEKRAIGLELATGEWCGFFNDDDSYEIDYIEQMMNSAAETNADVVYCAWSGNSECDFSLGSSTSGNFLFKTEIGRQVGYKRREYEADGYFINSLNESGARVTRVDRVLYHHNIQNGVQHG